MIWRSPPPLSPLSESSPRTTHHNPNVGTIELTISKVLAKGTKTGITAGNTGGPRLGALTMLANTARDLEEARKGLGEDNLNPYGVSYRSLLRAAYATFFPWHTNKMVLDSSMSPNDARCTNLSLE